MKGHVAVVCRHGVEFAVVVVRPSLMSGLRRERDEAVDAFSAEFGVPTVLMMESSRGIPVYWGRPDLVGFLVDLSPEQLQWREFTMCAA